MIRSPSGYAPKPPADDATAKRPRTPASGQVAPVSRRVKRPPRHRP